jgi:hypothetical protein
MYIHVHVWTAWWLKGHNPGLKGLRCVQLHNVWWQQIPIPHSLHNLQHDEGGNYMAEAEGIVFFAK